MPAAGSTIIWAGPPVDERGTDIAENQFLEVRTENKRKIIIIWAEPSADPRGTDIAENQFLEVRTENKNNLGRASGGPKGN